VTLLVAWAVALGRVVLQSMMRRAGEQTEPISVPIDLKSVAIDLISVRFDLISGKLNLISGQIDLILDRFSKDFGYFSVPARAAS
jgi:hypothetical protein